MFFKKNTPVIPADVPVDAHKTFLKNYLTITKKTDHLLLLAADQKLEHLMHDFYGPHIHADALNPEQLFRIAAQKQCGAFTTHLGLIARYGTQYSAIPYIAKLNGKTDLIAGTQQDPISEQLWSVEEALRLKEEKSINICGVGYTIYLGSSYESAMLAQAAQIVAQAHEHGLVTILWIYPRGKAIANDQEPLLLAGAAGVALSLGSDFVKIKAPHATAEKTSAQWLQLITQAAGNTKVICAGGQQQEPEAFLKIVHEQLTLGASAGVAVGRNVFQRSFAQATALTKALAALVYEKKDLEYVLKLYKKTVA
ncbi:aldolase [Candidatus Dependentiae bacterium HGW-Dependentiae-1]|nr:MAG: aldolase [Candidatus Dependentiae bacterium HGW-Dependentiae-1]